MPDRNTVSEMEPVLMARVFGLVIADLVSDASAAESKK
jgi:hypothetical protein